MTVDDLHLSPVMDARARDLLAAFPSVRYLSGRRDLATQANAMAANVGMSRSFIGRTYLHAAPLQAAVDAHPELTSVDDLAELLYTTLLEMPPDAVRAVSDHLTGDAVDLVPMEDAEGELTPTGRDVYTWIHDCPDTKTFLVREHGLVRWHWACHPSTEV